MVGCELLELRREGMESFAGGIFVGILSVDLLSTSIYGKGCFAEECIRIKFPGLLLLFSLLFVISQHFIFAEKMKSRRGNS